ncbi:MAG TPA: hypothetical protein VII65_00350 [Acidimicrobiales bacterium]
MHSEHWQLEPEDHDYPAATTYLSLIGDPQFASAITTLFQSAPTLIYEAKDLLRASQLPLLARDNAHVAKDLSKVKSGHKLSPVLLIRGSLLENHRLIIADGYHRVCASYWIDENAQIPCRLVDAPN